MAYSGSNPARCIVDVGLASAQGSTQITKIFGYSSTHYSSDITAANFFTGCGLGSNSTNCINMTPGDLVCNVTSAGFVSWHMVTSITTSTAAANTAMGNNPSVINATVSAATS